MDEPYLIFFVIIVLILLIALMMKIFRIDSARQTVRKETLPAGQGAIGSERHPSEIGPGPDIPDKQAIIHPEVSDEPPPPFSPEIKSTDPEKDRVYPEIDLIDSSFSIMDSLNRLCQKFNVETFTLASTDGLVIASSFAGGARDAAYFSNLYLREKITRRGDIAISSLKHQNQNLIFIIRSQRNLDSEEIEAIKSDAKRILLFWL
ncbi:MAG TPA: hypothetical protein ENO00_04580 [Deltaproteobacteria bacterium]|nr:hypothetical protein [Deltaproteobacteria bacterium]